MNINKVRDFAFKKHAGQTRPNKANEPKTIHLEEVANWVRNANGSIFAITAAYLHDTVEDTDTTNQEIIENFGKKVGLLVDELTDPDDFYFLPLLLEKKNKLKGLRHLI